MAASELNNARQLLQQAEKILLHPIHPHLMSYCPTMDLIAVVTDEENLDVYRINGQRAFGFKRKDEDVTVDAIQWQFNGKSIAISWSDGSTDLVSAETGKTSHKDLMLPSGIEDEANAMEETPPARVKCIGWGLNFIDIETVKRRTGTKPKVPTTATAAKTIDLEDPTTEDWDEFRDDTTLEDFLQRQPDFQALDIAPDLPDQLAVMDMESLLPRLPAIPLAPTLPFMRISAADSGSFSSQVQVDSLLHAHHLKDHNSVDMLIRCSDRGTVHPSIYDSLETVDVQLPSAWGLESRPLLHTNHPYSCTHSLLMRITPTDPKQQRKSRLALVPLTLNFIPSAGIYLHLIAAKTSQLQNLLLYITQTQQRLRAWFKSSQDLPSKFMMNITETLEEKGQGDLVTNLFHLACTGSCPPLIKEWLVDELAEQGHKRWDNAVQTGLVTVLQLLHENLIPALDRCSIVISRLRGLAQFHDQDWIFSAPISDFTGLLDILKNMRLLAHKALLYTSEEKRQFHAFSKWLRFCIDYQATAPDSQTRHEMDNREPGVDITLVLEYIKYGLVKSDVTPFLRPEAQLNPKPSNIEAASYEETKKAVELSKEGAVYKEEALCLEHVFGHLNQGVTGLLKQVSNWQENNIQMDSGIVLEETSDEEQEAMMDLRMVSEVSTLSFIQSPTPPQPSQARPPTTPNQKTLTSSFSTLHLTPDSPPRIPTDNPSQTNPDAPDTISTYIAVTSPSTPHTLHIHRLTHSGSITTLPKDILAYAISTLDFSPIDPSASILDAKFADDKTILVLLSHSGTDAQKTTKGKDKNGKVNVILSLQYTPPRPSSTNKATHPLTYTPLAPTALSSALLPTGAAVPNAARQTIPISTAQVQRHTRHVFEGRFTPLRLIVNGRRGRRVVVVLGSDRKHYRVLDLDYANEGAGWDSEEVEEGGDVEMGDA